jgi:hypothetical protein
MVGSQVCSKGQRTCCRNLMAKVVQLLDALHSLLAVDDEPVLL